MGFLLFRHRAQTTIQLVQGAVTPGIRQPEREADHSSPSNAEVKNAWSYTSILPVHFNGAMLN
jgi:hypothetical protein